MSRTHQPRGSDLFAPGSHRQGDHRGRRVRARRPDADEPLLHPVPDLPGRAVDPRRRVVAGERTTRSRASSRNSSNIGMSQVVEHVPPQVQYDYLRAFGLGEPTGLEPAGGEPTGDRCRPPASGRATSGTRCRSARAVAVNAVQMASVYATIANDGVRVQPTLIAGTYNASGRYVPAGAAAVPPGHPAEDGARADPDPAAGARAWTRRATSRGATSPATRSPPRPAPRSEPGRALRAVRVRVELHRDGAGQRPAGRGRRRTCRTRTATSAYFGVDVAGPVFYNVMNFALQTLQIQPQPGLSRAAMFGSTRADIGYPLGVIRPARLAPRPLSGLAELPWRGRTDFIPNGPGASRRRHPRLPGGAGR